MKKAWIIVMKATEKQPQARNSERSDDVRGIVDTDTPKITTKMLVNKLLSVLYPCQSDAQLYRPTSVLEIATKSI